MALSSKLPTQAPNAVLLKVEDATLPVLLAFLRDHFRYTHLRHFMTQDTLESWVYGSNPHLIVDGGELTGVAWWDQEDDFNHVEKAHLLIHRRKARYTQAYMALAVIERFGQSDGPDVQLIEVCHKLNPSLHQLVDTNPATVSIQGCGNPLFSHLTRAWYTTDIYAVTPVTLARWLQGPPPRVEEKTTTGTTSAKPRYWAWLSNLRQKFKNHQHPG